MGVVRIEVALKPELPDPAGAGVVSDFADLGIEGVNDVRTVRVYLLKGELSPDDAERAARELFSDPVVEVFAVERPVLDESAKGLQAVEVIRRPGVMDPVRQSALKSLADLGVPAEDVRTSRRYLIRGDIGRSELERGAGKVLANDVIEEFVLGTPEKSFPVQASYEFKEVRVELRDASDEELMRISREGQLFLNLKEMQTIRDFFVSDGRDPRDVELETLAQTWSEHCVHKTMRGYIRMGEETIDNLLKSTIFGATRELDLPWCLSVFEDNAGVIEFDDEYAVCFKVETHNHPSALEPYGGAGTGIGGVIRDPMGTGLGAKPFASTDVFCFGMPDTPHAEVPKGVLHPKRIMKGVVAGVRDYGNRMGIPTVNGAVLFDQRYLGNCLVYCGNLGILPKDKVHKQPRAGDLAVVCGGRTGRDGIHGVTFASGELTVSSERVSSGAVQIGNPIEEKKMVDVILQARDEGLYDAITDCGGGGLSSAVGEMGIELGVEVNLDKIPLKYDGLSYTEVWISEAQERMLLAVPPEKGERLRELFASEDVESTVIGRFTGEGKLILRYAGKVVCDIPMEFLHNGLPRIVREAVWEEPDLSEPQVEERERYDDELRRILGSPNVCSKEWVVRQYDHEVQGGSVVKPLVGALDDGPGDAAVVMPRLDSKKAVVISSGINPRYGDIDPYHMAASSIDEAVRNCLAVGGDFSRIALLDNFSWGNTDKPDRLGALVRAARACGDVSRAFGTPFVSGKDSLNNEFKTEAGTICIPHTLLVSAFGVIDDVARCVTMDLKKPGNLLYVVGLTKDELGGSHFYMLLGEMGKNVPKVDVELARKVFEGISRATGERLVRACHDCSEGGLAVALGEMAFAGGLGLEADLSLVPTDADLPAWAALFSESNSRFVVEVEPGKAEAFERALGDAPFARVGEVTDAARVVLKHAQKTVIDSEIGALKRAWKAPLAW